MYTLYFIPGACSLATQVILRELNQPVEIINKNSVENYAEINPTGAVPSLTFGETTMTEGVGIILHLLEEHSSDMLPSDAQAKRIAIRDLLFANATMHPAYGRMFFINARISNEEAKAEAFAAGATMISDLWKVVEGRLGDKQYLGGDTVSAADILLAVYSRWGQFFPAEIEIGPKARAMIDRVIAMPTFQASLAEEDKHQ